MISNNQVILHIEDNQNNRMLVKRLLESEGYRVLEAATARQALEILNSQIPQMILMDINMPDIDGYTLTSQIKSIPSFSRVPVVAITANVMKGDREKTYQAGCDGYIEKPIDVDTFVDLIRQYI